MRPILALTYFVWLIAGAGAAALAEPPPTPAPLVLRPPSGPRVESLEPIPVSARLRLSLPKPTARHVVPRRVDPLLRPIAAPRAPDRVGIGHTYHLRGGRVFVVDLTPSPNHCAPLMSVTF